MSEKQSMYFYVTATSAEPVGPKASHTYRGRPRKAHTIDEASRACRWPETALVALHNATYPPEPDQHDRWIDDWAEALFLPRVRERLTFWKEWIGIMPVEAFLVAVLDDFDCLDGQCKKDALIRAMNIADDIRDNECGTYRAKLAAERDAKGADDGRAE